MMILTLKRLEKVKDTLLVIVTDLKVDFVQVTGQKIINIFLRSKYLQIGKFGSHWKRPDQVIQQFPLKEIKMHENNHAKENLSALKPYVTI